MHPSGTRRPIADIVIVLLPVAAALMGCRASGPERFSLTGNVTLDGQPLPEGEVLFRPVGGTQGQTAAAMIDNGSFHIPAQRGPVAGTYAVVITADRETGRMMQPLLPGEVATPQREQYIPAKYNDRTTLTLEIKADRDDLHFELQSN